MFIRKDLIILGYKRVISKYCQKFEALKFSFIRNFFQNAFMVYKKIFECIKSRSIYTKKEKINRKNKYDVNVKETIYYISTK